jgi:hypothetical protein
MARLSWNYAEPIKREMLTNVEVSPSDSSGGITVMRFAGNSVKGASPGERIPFV